MLLSNSNQRLRCAHIQWLKDFAVSEGGKEWNDYTAKEAAFAFKEADYDYHRFLKKHNLGDPQEVVSKPPPPPPPQHTHITTTTTTTCTPTYTQQQDPSCDFQACIFAVCTTHKSGLLYRTMNALYFRFFVSDCTPSTHK